MRAGAGRWGASARFLHWLSAAAIFAMLALGVVMVEMVAEAGARFELYQWHKSGGALLALVIAVRIGWRLAAPGPPPAPGAPWLRRVAALVHAGLYLALLATLVTGYAMVSTSPLPLPVGLPFGLKLPNLLAPDFAASEQWKAAHHLAAAVLAGLTALHVAAALKHRFLDRDAVLARMWPP